MSKEKITKILDARAGAYQVKAHSLRLAQEHRLAQVYEDLAKLLREVAEALKDEGKGKDE